VDLNMHINKSIKCSLYTIILALLTLLIGCSGSPSHLATVIRASGFLNPNIYNQASPVVVSIYQLKSATTFQQANFFSLNNNLSAILAADLLDKYNIEIRPEQKQELKLELTPNTNYVGVIAAFRNPDSAQWRQVVAVRPGKNAKVVIILATQSVTLQKK
jgi:type VI secretion system protein VasD